MRHSHVTANLDEGVDFDEEGEGDIRFRFVHTDASNNNDDGFKLTEEDGGNVYARAVAATAFANGGKGIVLEEEDEGDFEAVVIRSSTADNDDSDDTGIEAVQQAPGTGTLRVVNSDIADGIDTDGVDQL